MEPIVMHEAILFKNNMIICLWCLFSCYTILSCFTYGGCFGHDRIASLRKVEILMPFTNSYNYKI
jgi:hypothetical protein